MVSWQASGSQVATRISFPVSRNRVRWNRVSSVAMPKRSPATAAAWSWALIASSGARICGSAPAGVAQHEGRQRLQRQPDLEDLAQPVGADLHQPHAAIGHADDDALALQQAQRLADRHAADVQAAGDVGLDDAVARHEDAGRGGLHDGLDDVIDQRARGQRLELAGAMALGEGGVRTGTSNGLFGWRRGPRSRGGPGDHGSA